MSTPINDGGPAFPVDHEFVNPRASVEELKIACGMTLRDWFAGQALIPKVADAEKFNEQCLRDSIPSQITHKVIAESCYRQADAMLAARKQEGKT